MNAILVVATVQSWFLAALVARRRDRRLSDTVLAVWLVLMGMHTGLYYVLPRVGTTLPWVSALNSAFPFLQGPMLYFYVDTLTGSRRRLRPSYVGHLLPAAAFVAYPWWAFPAFSTGAHGGTRTVHIFSVSSFFTGLLLLSVPVYIAWSLFLIGRYRQRLTGAVSTSDRIDLGWLRTLVAGLGFVWVVVLGTFLARALAGGDSANAPTHLVFWAVALFVYAIGYQAYHQRNFVTEPVAEIMETAPPPGGQVSEVRPARGRDPEAARATAPAHGDREAVAGRRPRPSGARRGPRRFAQPRFPGAQRARGQEFLRLRQRLSGGSGEGPPGRGR